MEVFGRQRDNVREKKKVSKPKRITRASFGMLFSLMGLKPKGFST
jgi:hypothetical protein